MSRYFALTSSASESLFSRHPSEGPEPDTQTLLAIGEFDFRRPRITRIARGGVISIPDRKAGTDARPRLDDDQSRKHPCVERYLKGLRRAHKPQRLGSSR